MTGFSEIDQNIWVIQHDSWQVIDSTKLASFRRCQRLFLLQYLFGWLPIIEPNDLVFGRGWHGGMDVYALHGYTEDSIEAAYQEFLKIYREVYPEETDIEYGAKTPANASLAFIEYAGQYATQDSYRILHTEIADLIPISPTRRLAVKIDRIIEDDFGRKQFMDHKTGSEVSKRWNDQWEMSRQMTTYYHALCCLYPHEMVSGGIVDGAIFRKKGNAFLRVPIFRSTEILESYVWETNYYMDMIEYGLEDLMKASPDDKYLKAFPCNDEGCSKYRGCPYQGMCSSMANPMTFYNRDSYRAGQPEAPPGMYVRFWNPFDEWPEAKKFADCGLQVKGFNDG